MYYRTREGEITASDTYTSLSGLYGKSTTASIQVPANVSRIVGAMVATATDSASNAAATFAVSLSGDGLSPASLLVLNGVYAFLLPIHTRQKPRSRPLLEILCPRCIRPQPKLGCSRLREYLKESAL